MSLKPKIKWNQKLETKSILGLKPLAQNHQNLRTIEGPSALSSFNPPYFFFLRSNFPCFRKQKHVKALNSKLTQIEQKWYVKWSVAFDRDSWTENQRRRYVMLERRRWDRRLMLMTGEMWRSSRRSRRWSEEERAHVCGGGCWFVVLDFLLQVWSDVRRIDCCLLMPLLRCAVNGYTLLWSADRRLDLVRAIGSTCRTKLITKKLCTYRIKQVNRKNKKSGLSK